MAGTCWPVREHRGWARTGSCSAALSTAGGWRLRRDRHNRFRCSGCHAAYRARPQSGGWESGRARTGTSLAERCSDRVGRMGRTSAIGGSADAVVGPAVTVRHRPGWCSAARLARRAGPSGLRGGRVRRAGAGGGRPGPGTLRVFRWCFDVPDRGELARVRRGRPASPNATDAMGGGEQAAARAHRGSQQCEGSLRRCRR
jgi:hypothetical protein